MAIFNIRKARREGARLVIAFAGVSGSGKTRSALELALGLAGGDASKIGFIDTENKRGSLYADVLKNEAGQVQNFYIGDLEPPFSPERYSQAILAFQSAGVEVLIIDSISHEWEGTGGILEMREPLPGKAGTRDNYAKAEHKKMMNTLLQSSMHVIVCVRAREKVEMKKINGQTVYEQKGLQPIAEKNFMFEMTASLMMWDSGKTQQTLKCPDELKQILGRGEGYITHKDGIALRDWVNGGEQIDVDVARYRASLLLVCEQGMDALKDAWAKVPKKVQQAINGKNGCPSDLKLSAEAYDKTRAAPQDESLDSLNDALMGNSTQA